MRLLFETDPFRRLLILFILVTTGCLVWFAWHEEFAEKQSTRPCKVELTFDAVSLPVSTSNNSTGSPSAALPVSYSAVQGGGANPQHPDISCDEECLRFRNVLLYWPSDKPKAAVYFLAKPDRLGVLNNTLATLHSRFLSTFDYPVIVFHETDSRDVLQRTFRAQHANIRLFLQEIQFSLPAHVNASPSTMIDYQSKQFPIGYRHMCRFHAKQVYEQQILHGLEYIWRLDDDSELLSTITYDLFAFMKSHGFQYGYIAKDMDVPQYVQYLWESARHYKKLRKFESPYFDKWTERVMFYNNFEVSALSLWTSHRYQDYINYVDLLGGIYNYRWGDAPIKTTAVTLLLREQDVHLFTNISYRHQHISNVIVRRETIRPSPAQAVEVVSYRQRISNIFLKSETLKPSPGQ